MTLTYKDAGVDIDAGNSFVGAIKAIVRSTRRPGADTELGGFGGLFDLRAAGYDGPKLLAAADGVGTKLKIAAAIHKFDTIGIDLVAMCVNDLVVQGADPLFFLDYYATPKLDHEIATDIVSGIGEGCRQARCSLIGGETAEMPDFYSSEDFDLAGFCVGAVQDDELLPRKEEIEVGDVILGLASSGPHANGYSLIRKVVEYSGLRYTDEAPFNRGRTLGEALLEPTRIYVRSCLEANKSGHVKAYAHITGGSFEDNIPRILPDDLEAQINEQAWGWPPVFRWLQDTGQIPDSDFHRTFNCGIGMIAIVSSEWAGDVEGILKRHGENVIQIGFVSSVSDRNTLKKIAS